MSTRYPGGVITKTPVVPAGPYEDGAAPGIWTLDQQLQAQKAGIWPIAGNVPNYIEDVFSTYLYTGNGSTQTITNGIDLSGKGGLTWIKQRTGGSLQSNWLMDTVRGAGQAIRSNTTNASVNVQSDFNQVFLSSGFSFNATSGAVNGSGNTYASWTFREQPKFFDIVTYTGNGAARTIAHNLGSVPGCIIVKSTSAVGDWPVYHRGLGNTGAAFLNETYAFGVNAAYWNNTDPTSSVFTVGTGGTGTNINGVTYVAYLFAHDAGGFGLTGTDNVISCGSYVGAYPSNVNVTLGYEPQLILVKNATQASDWFIYDVMRGMSYSDPDYSLAPNLSAAENGASGAATSFNPTSTGFIVNSGLTAVNVNGDTHIYIAIRRGPMKVPTDATKVFSPIAATASTGTSRTVGFPADMTINTATGISGIRLVADRLRGYANASSDLPPMLDTNATTAERTSTSATVYNVWNTTALDGPYYSSYASIWWHFRRAPGFFDEVCWTGTSADQTLTHNLQATPELIIYKARGATSNWYTACAFASSNYSNLQLNLTTASSTVAYSGGGPFSAQPTSTQFSVGQFYNTSTMVAYLFATVAGVSKVGSYTGNGTTQTIDCGFGAGGVRFVLIKRTDAVGGWYVYDTARGMTVLTDPYLFINSTAAEVATLGSVTTVSTGFALNSAILAAINVNAGTYIFLAIA